MSERHLQCHVCGVIAPESAARSIPTYRADGNAYVDGYYCDAHAVEALATTRGHVAGLDFDDDERDDMMPLVLLHALLRARGQVAESLGASEAKGEGMERVRQQALALLARLSEVRLPIVEPAALCSACWRALPASQVRVIPWFNEDVDNFVTTFRCGECVAGSLAETRARLEGGEEREIALLAAFFERHAITIHEHRRGDPPEVVRPILMMMLGMVERGEMTLPIGETIPLSEVMPEAAQSSTSRPREAEAAQSSTARPREAEAAQSSTVRAWEAEGPEREAPSLWGRVRRLFGRD